MTELDWQAASAATEEQGAAADAPVLPSQRKGSVDGSGIKPEFDGEPWETGDLARAVFYSQRVVRRQTYPRVRGMRLPGARVALSIARLFYWYSAMAGKVARLGRSRWAQLRDIAVIARRHNLDAQAYYMFELYRPEHFARAGGYVTRYETKNGLYKLLQQQHPEYLQKTPLDDKVLFREFCIRHGLSHPALIAVAADGVLRMVDGAAEPPQRDLFVKPINSKGSNGTEVIRRSPSGAYVGASGLSVDWPELSRLLAERSKDQPLLVQGLLYNHPDMAELAGESVVAIRMITCWDQRGEPILTHAMLRIIPKLEIKWALRSELGAAVDLETGRLGPMTGDKRDSLMSWWDQHPVTGAQVTGRVVPDWTEAKRLVLAAQRATHGRYMVGWDVAITPEGPVLLEGNAFPDVDFPQRTHRRAIGDSPLGPPLHDWLMDLRHRVATGTLKRWKF